MFDTMTLTKIAAAFCGALLVLLLGYWVSDFVFHPGGHGKDYGEHKSPFVIEVPDTSVASTDGPVDSGPLLEELLASAELDKGERVFRRCGSCHALEDGENGVGPHLNNLIGRPLAGVEGYEYSDGFGQIAEAWTPENLYVFLEKPKTFAPNTKMNFPGLKKPADRANLIAYLATITN